MSWWNELLAWAAASQDLLVGVALPVVAILVAALLAAGISRSAVRRLVEQRDRESRANAIAALIVAGTHAATWHSQSAAAKDHSQQVAASADIAVRLMPVQGAGLAADWAAHQLTDMRINSVSFSFQADQTLREYRDRLLDWADHPRRAKKLFAQDLERWRYETSAPDPVLAEQTKWAEERLESAGAPASSPAVPSSATVGAPTVGTAATTAANADETATAVLR